MKHIFWNEQQQRMRTLWRLLAQFLLLIISTVCLGVVVLLPLRLTASTTTDTSALAMLSGIISLPATLLSVWLVGHFLDRRPFKDFGFHFSRAWWLDFGFGLALGAILMTGLFLIERSAGWITLSGTMQAPSTKAFAASVFLQAAFFLCVGIYEELQFRGYRLLNLTEGLNAPFLGPKGALALAWIVTSLTFGLGHAANPNATVISTLNLMAAGVFLGVGYVLTGELAISIGLHITWNFFQGTVFGFPVSGGVFGSSFISIVQGGPETWTGGKFGPEAGLLGIAAIIVGSALTVLWVRRHHGEAVLQGRLADYSGNSRHDPAGRPE